LDLYRIRIFYTVPGGLEYANRSVLSWHYYCWTAYDQPLNIWEYGTCDLSNQDMFIMRRKDVERLGGASFMTEFGLCDGNDEQGIQECNLVMQRADSYLESWTYWDWSLFNASGQIEWSSVRLFSRTYAYAIAGNITSMFFDPDTADFTLSYTPENLKLMVTEIYLNEKLRYSTGYKVTIDGSATWYSPSTNYVFVEHEQGTTGQITVTIQPT